MRRNAVPKLGFTLVQEIDCRKVKVFLMPRKERLPRTHIQIATVHSRTLLFSKGHFYQRIKLVQVPRLCCIIHQAVPNVCSVQWWRQVYSFPKLILTKIYHCLNLFVSQFISHLIVIAHFSHVLFKSHGRFCLQITLIKTILAACELLDWVQDR